MKKNVLFFLSVILSLTAAAQATVDIFATGAVGSYITGNSTNATRTDNNIVTTGFGPATTRGYAVFDLSTIPAGAVVTDVELYYNMAVVSPGGGGGWNTRGYVGDLSTITTAGTLFTTMGLAPTLWTTAYPNMPGNASMPTNATAETFVNTNIGALVSIIWSTNAIRTYTITGETGTTSTTGTHAPYLRVTYNCPGITSVSANGPAGPPPCPNTSFGLTGNAVGTISSYLWTGPLGFTSTMLNPTVAAGLPASGGFTLTATDATGCTATATTIVTVSPIPVADVMAITNVAFCDADSATLSAVTPGLDYQWYNGTTLIPGATDQNYVTYATGNYKVEVTDGVGCTALTAAATPTVLLSTPLINPGGSVLLCAGDNGTISVETNGVTAGIVFQWQKDGIDIPAAAGSSYVVSASGIYKCILTVPTSVMGCMTTSAESDVIVNDYPLPTINFVGTNLSTSGLYANYQWFLNTVAIAGATSATYHPTATGSYRVRVTDANGCSAFSGSYPVNIVSSVGHVTAGDIRLYPNPVTSVLQIESPVKIDVIVSTIEGKIIQRLTDASSIDVTDYPSGLYLVAIFNQMGERIATEKITKQ